MEKRLNSFNIEPSAQVWEGVEAVLHEKKKRRFIIWWWVPVAALLLLGSGWWMMGNKKEMDKAVDAVAVTKTGSITTNRSQEQKAVNDEKKPAASKPQEYLSNNEKISITNNKGDRHQPSITTNPIAVSKQNAQTGISSKGAATTTGSTHHFSTEKSSIQGNVDGQEATVLTSNSQEKNTTATKGTAPTKSVEASTDSLKRRDSTVSAKNGLPNTERDRTISVKEKEKNVAKNKKHQWSLVAGGAISLVRNNNLFSNFSDEKVLDNLGNSSGISAPGSLFNSRTNTSKQLPHTGYSFLIGANYQRNISRHWDGNIGLQYRYIQNKQQLDSIKETVTNYTHWLELPVNIQYTLNPYSRNKFQLLAGASAAYSFSQNWLVVPAAGNLYYNKAQNNGVIVNFNAGIAMQMNNGYKLSLVGEQSLTPIHKNNNYKYYWRQWGVQMNMPLSKLFK